MEEEKPILEKYETLRKELQEGFLTEKGFHSKVRSLIQDIPQAQSMDTFRDVADIFEEMKKVQQSKTSVKKKQFPLTKGEEKTVLKVKILPMQWRSKTKFRAGRYHKLILEEEPPRFLMNHSDGYEDVLRVAVENLWTDKEKSNAQYTLCNADGSKWPKLDFEKEFCSLGDVPDIWKKTYVG